MSAFLSRGRFVPGRGAAGARVCCDALGVGVSVGDSGSGVSAGNTVGALEWATAVVPPGAGIPPLAAAGAVVPAMATEDDSIAGGAVGVDRQRNRPKEPKARMLNTETAAVRTMRR